MHTYAAMAHKGRNAGKTIEIHADSLLDAKCRAAAALGVRNTSDVSVQLQKKADGTEVIGAIL